MTKCANGLSRDLVRTVGSLYFTGQITLTV